MSNVSIRPLGTRVLVEPLKAEEKTAGGLYIPDSAKEKPHKGTVIATGKGKKDEEMEVSVGDTVIYGKYSGTELQVDGLENLKPDEWYMMIANHQSWVDILVLLRVFNRRIPYLKFFLKKSLIWVPLLGLAWWALEFPFMRRYSKAEIDRNPSLRGKDIE